MISLGGRSWTDRIHKVVQDGPWTSALTEGQNSTEKDILLSSPVETYKDPKVSMRNLVNQWRPKTTNFQWDPKRPIKTSDHQLYYTQVRQVRKVRKLEKVQKVQKLQMYEKYEKV